MKVFTHHRRLASTIACAFLMGTAGANSDPDPDLDLPQPLTVEHFRELKENSPFTRALNLSESLMLTGLAQVDGKPVATLMDRESKQTYVISEVPNPQGWKLVEITSPSGADLEAVSALISVGGERVSVRYDERQLQLKPNQSKSAPSTIAKDSRSAPTEQEKKEFGKMIHNKWQALDKEQQGQAKQIMKDKMKANPKISDRQRGEMINGIVDYVATDKARAERTKTDQNR
jgi:hypothetical protein